MKKCLVVACVLAAQIAAAPAPAGAQMPDPAVRGPLEVDRSVYSAGSTEVTDPGGTYRTLQRVRGDLHAPATGDGPYPIVLVQHGSHSSCETAGLDSLSVLPCDDGGSAVSTEDLSYPGHDYVASNLASHGYVVMSVDVNAINERDGAFADGGIHARAMVIGESLDLLSAWTRGTAAGPPGAHLAGRLDMSRIGLMGHSRGGEGVTAYLGYDRVRTDGPSHGVDAVVALAAIDSTRVKPAGVAFATVLPYCDGDVADLAGASAWERGKAANSAAGFPQVQWSVNGANHNYFNSRWEADDARNVLDPECALDTLPTRLSAPEQRAVGLVLAAGFLRRYVGGETAFDPLVTGAAMPASACPDSGEHPRCESLVMGSYVAPAARRRLLLEPGATSPLTVNALGGELAAAGFAVARPCTPGRNGAGECGSVPNRSTTRQLTLAWTRPATLRAAVPAGSADVSGFGALHLRAATNFDDPLNEAGREQDLVVRLTDLSGRSAAVAVAGRSAALEPAAGADSREVVLNGIRIPLPAFAPVDLTALAAVTFEFGDRTRSGSIQLADAAFQE